MIIIQDSNEKIGHHDNIEQYCDKNSIALYRERLEVGDYMLATFTNGRICPIGDVSVDVKGGGLTELATDLYRDKQAFNKKYSKCYKNKIKLVVLVEEEVKGIKDIVNWKSPHTRITGKCLLEMMHEIKIMYGVKFMFCKKEKVGETVVRILTEGNNE